MKAEKTRHFITACEARFLGRDAHLTNLSIMQAHKNAAERELAEFERLATLGRTLEEQHPQFDGIDDYSSLDGMDFSEGARLIKLGMAIDKVFELYPIILGASSATSKDPGPRAWKDAEDLLGWYEGEVGVE